jgi:hypothetical protein
VSIGSGERRRLVEGAAAGECPEVATVALVAECTGDAAAVLERCREVMLAVVDRRALPAWFADACAPEMSREEADAWLARWQRLAPEQVAMERDQAWALEDWLAWFGPEERQWFWWDATVQSADRMLLEVEVAGWPAPLGSLVWLMRASGAETVVRGP